MLNILDKFSMSVTYNSQNNYDIVKYYKDKFSLE